MFWRNSGRKMVGFSGVKLSNYLEWRLKTKSFAPESTKLWQNVSTWKNSRVLGRKTQKLYFIPTCKPTVLKVKGYFRVTFLWKSSLVYEFSREVSECSGKYGSSTPFTVTFVNLYFVGA